MDCKRSKIGVALAVVFGIFLSCGTCFVAQAGAQDGSNSSKSQSVTDQIERATDKVNKNQVYQIEYKLKKGEEVVFMGDAEDGYLYVQGSEVEGWVQEFMLDG